MRTPPNGSSSAQREVPAATQATPPVALPAAANPAAATAAATAAQAAILAALLAATPAAPAATTATAAPTNTAAQVAQAIALATILASTTATQDTTAAQAAQAATAAMAAPAITAAPAATAAQTAQAAALATILAAPTDQDTTASYAAPATTTIDLAAILSKILASQETAIPDRQTTANLQNEKNIALITALTSALNTASNTITPNVALSSTNVPELARTNTEEIQRLLKLPDNDIRRPPTTFADCPERFNNTNDTLLVQHFVQSATLFKAAHGMSDEWALQTFRCLLGPEAALWWAGVQPHAQTWDNALRLFNAMYDPPVPPHTVFKEMSKDQEEGESCTSYIVRQRFQLTKLTTITLDTAISIELCYKGLRADIQRAVPRHTISNLDQLLQRCREAEQAEALLKSQINEAMQRPQPNKVAKYAATEQQSNDHQQRQSSAPGSRKTPNPFNRRPADIKPNPPGPSSPRLSSRYQQRYSEERGLACFGCGEPGVFRAQCPRCNNKLEANACICIRTPTISQNSLITVILRLGSHDEHAFFDGGSTVSLGSERLFQFVHRVDRTPLIKRESTLVMADGIQRTVSIAAATISGSINGHPCEGNINFLPERNSRTILGLDFLCNNGIEISYAQQSWRFVGERIWTTFPSRQSPPTPTTVTATTLQPARQPKRKQAVNAPSTSFPRDGKTQTALDQPIRPQPTPRLQTFVRKSPKKTTKAPMPYEPPADKRNRARYSSETHLPPILPTPFGVRVNEHVMMSGQQHARFQGKIRISEEAVRALLPKDKEPNQTQRPEPPPSSPYNPFIEMMDEYPFEEEDLRELHCNTVELWLRDDEAADWPPPAKEELQKCVQQYADVFAETGPATNETTHRIDTRETTPIASAPYRLAPVRRAILRRELDVMLAGKIIEESESPWASPVVMIPKKDGNVRVCVDYRRLNAVTIPDRYPLPRMDDLLHEARHSPYMSTLDLQSGYWQIPIADADQEKTAFITPFGMFQFRRMPFGLCNAPATFQRLMDRFRNRMPQVQLLVYLDDIILRSTTREQHIHDLHRVLAQLAQWNLRANRDKCRFAVPEVNYLGHRITQQGIETNPDKVAAISQMAPPHNIKQLNAFIQTCSWYRRFVPQFAERARPLTNLLRKNNPWTWATDEQNAYDDLKECLTTAPVLQQADETQPFIIKSDASAYAVGAGLFQGEGSEEHPVEYASRLLTSAERNYSTIEREALALVVACDKFRGYIEGAVTTVMTDHQPLRWLMSLKSPTGRLARWSLRLQQYNLNIQYIPGKTNVVADILSRPPMPEIEACSLECIVPRQSAQDCRTKQLADPDLAAIIECLEAGGDGDKFHRWTSRGFVLKDGVLFRFNPFAMDDVDEPQMAIPAAERLQILKTYHDDATAGHYGAQRTIARIASRYYWPGMRREITEHVRHCAECQRYKVANVKPAGLYHSTASRQRFETLSIDLFGPLPTSPEGLCHIFIIEDVASRWVELFALADATAKTCALTLLNEVILRYGMPRRIVSDHGPQFVSAVMQKLTFCLGIRHTLTPVYHPAANPVERKNRDLKPQLAIFVGTDHTAWPASLPSIRFAMNSSRCRSTGYTAAYLTFGRELRTADDVHHDLRHIVEAENFVAEVTPHLLRLASVLEKAREMVDSTERTNQANADPRRREVPVYQPGDLVWVTSFAKSNAASNFAAKLAPRRDGPYKILSRYGPASFHVGRPDGQGGSLGIYHTSALSPYRRPTGEIPSPVRPLRPRGRPRKVPPGVPEPHSMLDNPTNPVARAPSPPTTSTGRVLRTPARYQ